MSAGHETAGDVDRECKAGREEDSTEDLVEMVGLEAEEVAAVEEGAIDRTRFCPIFLRGCP